MSMTSYTDPNGTGGPPSGGGSGGNGGNGGFPPPNIANMAKPMSDAEEMLINYNERFKNDSPTLFRDGTIMQTIGALISKNKPNALLKGGAGVGKTKIVEDIARRLANNDSSIPDQLAGYTIYELPMANLIAGAGIVGQLEERIIGILDFATKKKNKAILFIDEIHTIVGVKSSDPTSSKVSQILKPALARGDLRLIGATTSQEARVFDDDPAFSRRFQHLIVDELTREQTVEILKLVKGGYSTHYFNKVQLPDHMVEELAAIADEHARADAHRPDSALTLMDRAMADAVIGQKLAIEAALTAGDTALATTLQAIQNQPLTEVRLTKIAKQLLTGLAKKNEYDELVVRDALTAIKGQDDVFEELIDALRRDQLEVFPRKKPIAWMFPGASGVGKTASAKIISEALTNQPPILLNMTEFAHSNDTAKILGSPPGYVGSDSNRELPFDTLESNPHRVIVLDEFEKCDNEVKRLFMSILDEGILRTAQGKILDFSKTIIIATTNAGREAMTKPQTGFIIDANKTKKLSPQELNRALRESFEPELLGRFTKIIAFNSIDREIFTEILVDGYRRQSERIRTEHPRRAKCLPTQLSVSQIDEIVQQCFDSNLGARPAETAIRTFIEDEMIKQLVQAQSITQAATSPNGGAATVSGSAAEPEEDPTS